MRPNNPLRGTSLLATAGALGFAITFAAAPPAPAAPDTQGVLKISVKDRSVAAGQPLAVSGRVPAGSEGQTVTLEVRKGRGGWSAVRTVTPKAGRFSFRVRPNESGAVRAVLRGGTSVQATTGAQAASATRTFSVRAVLSNRTRKLELLPGRRGLVTGVLRPARAGARVTLQRRSSRGWATIDRARTNDKGRYAFRFRGRGVGSAPVRVRFAGNQFNASSRRIAGRLNVYRRSQASWYGPGFYGNRTACGSTLGTGTMGVAHKTLPCGTMVSFRYNGRSVRVPVIDRGPFVGGREWDLTGAVKTRLGFNGHGTVLSTR